MGQIAVLIILFNFSWASTWRSSLYPENWQLGMKDAQERYLQDFSYAGYQQGEKSIPENPPGQIYNVFTQFGADKFGTFDATPEVQAAINAASSVGGGIVYFPPGYYRFDSELKITTSKIVLRGAGPAVTKLRFTSSKTNKAHIGFSGNISRGSDLFLAQDAPALSFTLRLSDARSLKVGDDISLGWKITDSFISDHQMTGVWKLERNNWYPIFRRKITAINTRVTPHLVALDVPLRYPLRTRDSASIRKEEGYIEEIGLEHLSISNVTSYKTAWEKEGVTAIQMNFSKNGWIKNVRSFSPPEAKTQLYHLQSVGIVLRDSKNITVTNTQLEGAQNRGHSGNGYLFEVHNSNEILIRDSQGMRGRHNFIQNGVFGTNGCVFLRVKSQESRGYNSVLDPIGAPFFSEYHRSLAIANLVDQSELNDGWLAYNRGQESSGAGHTATQNVFWNITNGSIASFQFGHGYIIGTTNTQVATTATGLMTHYFNGTSPIDFTEGLGQGNRLTPSSLYEDQLARRMARKKNTAIKTNNSGLAQ